MEVITLILIEEGGSFAIYMVFRGGGGEAYRNFNLSNISSPLYIINEPSLICHCSFITLPQNTIVRLLL